MDVGIEFGHYKVIEHIGRGGMADVWSARDKRLNRTVAIKTIARNLSSDTDPMKLFEREARTIARLEHPHILPIYEFGEFQGQLYIVMRYVSGGSLEDLLVGGALVLDDALNLARLIAQALDYAHANKVIHLDLKPSNILLDSYGSPYLADFGLATVLGPEGRAINPGSGTLLYMAPEQMTANVLDLRADVYSYCILIFHLVTGQLPFDAAIPMSIKQIQQDVLLPEMSLIRADIPTAFTRILQRGTTLDVKRRTQSIMEVYTALETAAFGVRSTQTRSRPAAAAKAKETGQVSSGDMPDMKTSRLGVDVAHSDAAHFDAVENLTTDLDVNRMRTQSYDDAPYQTDPEAKHDAMKTKTDLDFELDDAALGKTRQIKHVNMRPDTKAVSADEDAATLNITDELMSGTDQLARREALLIYTRARRSWAGGQGKFLLGITHFMLINDFYSRADEYGLEIDEAGIQMFLRGALEYDYEIDHWWGKLSDDSRRWVTLHALRSENPQARIRVLERLTTLADGDPPQIPQAIGGTIQVERHAPAKRTALRVLEARGSASADSGWRDAVFSPEIDGLLAHSALDKGDPETAEQAARTIGRIQSRAAVELIAARQRAGEKGALKALALVRDEAPSLPQAVSDTARLYAWLANTWRRLIADPLPMIWRFLLASLFGWLAMAAYVWISIPDVALIDPDRYGLSVSVGLTFGVIFGFQVLFASELPSRLRGFWHWWGRGFASLILGFVFASLSWAAFTWFFLRYPPESNIYLVGIGTAVGFAIPVIVRLPALVSGLITAVGIGIPLYIAWVQNLPPILYFREDQSAEAILIGVMVLLGVGAYAQRLWKGLKKKT